jgi:acyl carrier protein
MMEVDQRWQLLYEKVQEIISETLDVDIDTVAPKTTFDHDLEVGPLGSIDGTDLLMEFEDQFDVHLSADQAKIIHTVEELVNCLYELGATTEAG